MNEQRDFPKGREGSLFQNQHIYVQVSRDFEFSKKFPKFETNFLDC